MQQQELVSEMFQLAETGSETHLRFQTAPHPVLTIIGQLWRAAADEGRPPRLEDISLADIRKKCATMAKKHPDKPSVFFSKDLSRLAYALPRTDHWWMPPPNAGGRSQGALIRSTTLQYRDLFLILTTCHFPHLRQHNQHTHHHAPHPAPITATPLLRSIKQEEEFNSPDGYCLTTAPRSITWHQAFGGFSGSGRGAGGQGEKQDQAAESRHSCFPPHRTCGHPVSQNPSPAASPH
jgi:hypothetical protein